MWKAAVRGTRPRPRRSSRSPSTSSTEGIRADPAQARFGRHCRESSAVHRRGGRVRRDCPHRLAAGVWEAARARVRPRAHSHASAERSRTRRDAGLHRIASLFGRWLADLLGRALVPRVGRPQHPRIQRAHLDNPAALIARSLHRPSPQVRPPAPPTRLNTSMLSGRSPGSGPRSVARSRIPIDARGPSHTYKRPSGVRRSNNTATR